MIHLIKDILTSEPKGQAIDVYGWVRTKRETKNLVFIEINDGSCFASIQATFDRDTGLDNNTEALLKKAGTGVSVKVSGNLVPSPAAGQRVELQANNIHIFGDADQEKYPLQKKRHSMEFLRDIAHLRARTNTFGAVARIRSQMAYAIHTFFQERGFQYVHTPIITGSDCEGAGEMFHVTTFDIEETVKKALKEKKDPDSFKIDYSQDFFGKQANLTVSGQLEGETYATALSRIYTFGPTFRAENSNTSRHLAEFWMVEPEMSFFTIKENMELAEEFIVYLLKWALEKCKEDLEFFDSRIKKGLIEMLKNVVNTPFTRLTYTEAIAELEKHIDRFEFKPYWGCDLQSEHERFLTEEVYKGPVIVTNYPKEIKSFYMKLNEDGKTVRAMDVLVPGLGEIIGGSEREENLDILQGRIKELGLREEDYWWYLDLRRYGTVPHSGFGLGFERLLLYVTGMGNIRDVIPFPRAPKLAEF
ncbi:MULTISPECIES: asparagine--tRNA ligase [Treponema]|uniref:Asparagine--tRNA ligase n=1 Tax=Treponema denticola (strain ATCC 35405 / DSM 14222 / CIP 103919 / JCM 8153 / KCTC 15104) TaxID=243275 RepID=SYN_TREDE|nr:MULTISPECIES: asparagine--tRNA ligase [Treponema]Q73P19.1 RecName: Full=Asparagine--tRNA ligase; AltName: Full=Asparaginyl-tRNA synthetase; Short=AsnRS [Treponema denticola ATCC 35405]AAS11471.1 asparaginyl-tRNA synthetase [Treponema denticola ATCC 35405]EMB33961.1 asparaginyl-tRNA synthetase [Treponema denticola ATCC 35404]EMB36618.1 asparaginyl-tRNA synthetase [Treponema denticola ATCC 33521]HCY93967.1 asparagine--tRNA ligase [Treponema sp.]